MRLHSGINCGGNSAKKLYFRFRMMKAAIIAGGKGTRLKDHYSVPKPLVLLNGKPVIAYQFELLAQYGIKEVVLLLGHGAEEIQAYCGDGSKWGLQFIYSIEEEALGTAGSLKNAEKYFDDDFLVFYADVAINMDLHRFIRFHRNHKSKATLAVHPNDHPFDSDLLDCDSDGKINAFYAKPHPKGQYFRNLVNAAVYIFSPEIFRFIPEKAFADFGKNIFPELVHRCDMYAYNTIEYIKDMGTPARVKEVEEAMQSGKWAKANYNHPQKAIFFDRDGVLNLDPGFIKHPDEFMLYPFTSKAVSLANKSEFASIVVTNQSGIARNIFNEEMLHKIHHKMEWMLGEEGAKLDAIYFCPHHPDKGFPEENPDLKIDCDCRKPKPGMLLKAAREFCIDLSHSWMIGDTGRDIQAARSAGVTPVAVRTGHALADTDDKPDFFFDNVFDAVDFIVHDPCQPLFEKVKKQFDASTSSGAFLILIGGNSGSGKSTVAASLKKKFSESGIHSTLVHLDHWIKPASMREDNENVFSRFRMEQLEEDLQSFWDGEIISVPQYDRRTRAHKGHVVYGKGKSELIIVEGVPALACNSLLPHADLRIFCDINEDLYKERFFARYIWKGLSEEAIESLFKERIEDERPYIDVLKEKADIVYTLK